MDNFHFSLWVFDDDFILSVTILVMCCFITSFLITKIATSQTLADLVTGKTSRSVRKRRQEILMAMRHHIDTVRQGRTIYELDEWELKHIKELKEFYYGQLKDLNDR